MRRLTVSMPEAMFAALSEEAERMGGCDKSAVVRRAVREYFARRDVTAEMEALAEEVQRAIAPLATGESNGRKVLK